MILITDLDRICVRLPSPCAAGKAVLIVEIGWTVCLMICDGGQWRFEERLNLAATEDWRLGLALDVVADFSGPGDTVLDPFGSDSVREACALLGRKYVLHSP